MSNVLVLEYLNKWPWCKY